MKNIKLQLVVSVNFICGASDSESWYKRSNQLP